MRKINPWMVVMPAVILAVATACSAPAGSAISAPTDATAGPIKLDSCGREVVFDSPPQRVLAVGSEAPALLVAAGAGDKLTHYAGSLEVPFDAATKAVVDAAERVTEDSHDVSYEMILGSGADVVIGTDIAAGVDLDSLADRLNQAGVQMLTVSGYCAGFEGRSTGGLSGFDQIYRDVESYGRLFGTQQVAAGAVQDMRDRVAAAADRIDEGAGQRALSLYVPTAGTLGSYGHESLVSEQMSLLGLENVFSKVPKRYFEPSTEELVASAADKVFAMYLPTGSSAMETDRDVLEELRERPELDGLEAVNDDAAVVPLNYYYSSPGPLAVDGVELLAEKLATP
ncbi:ABC transporter substrate-binding protein [Paeniglutamicibacter psychrophenolicus]|uniref:Iron complex transport system substrate-binding protein n=1 Tax=Paeniglutamicibacter psychrophenolicus TaxID=257454 RepID=A0ABS4WJ29_9MICC|nr:ABC transporter substrate-binding protein [Paeniglutamicibacter psychrophenolicus]MBP2375549.1 iron complex transport system substrate-binding protein [Paeniglutamicibacter psychrophenolicus]